MAIKMLIGTTRLDLLNAEKNRKPVPGLVTYGDTTTKLYKAIKILEGKANRHSSYLSKPDGVVAEFRVISGWLEGWRIGFPATPENFQFTREQSSSSESPVGSFQPVIGYTSTGARKVSFTLNMFAGFSFDYSAGATNSSSYNGRGRLLDGTFLGDVMVFDQMQIPATHNFTGKVSPPIVEMNYAGIHIQGLYTCNITYGSTITDGEVDRATLSISITETEEMMAGRVFV